MNSKIARGAKNITGFITHSVWYDPPDAGRMHTGLLYALRVILITANSIRNKTILMRSSSLSYSTLLAVVPALAIGFSMLKGLGLEARLEDLLVTYLAAEQKELGNRLIQYISNTDFKALGAVGTGVLIYAVIMMLSNVEGAFNDIWGITRNRTLIRKISDYISVLLLGPLLIVLSAAMITSMSSNTIVQTLSEYRVFKDFFILFDMVIPYLVLWLAFAAIYMLMPNTRVRFVPALIAGVVCGTVWQLAFEVYTGFNIGVTRYNKIYGTFAALPVFIIWIYVSWVIVLVGAKISNAIQNIRTYQLEFSETGASPGQRQAIGLYIFHEIARHFHEGLYPPEAEKISRHLSVSLRLVQETLSILSEKGLLRQVEGAGYLFQPAMDLKKIKAADIFNAIRDHGKTPWEIPEHAKNPALEKVISARKQAADQIAGEITMNELVSG
ncbi:MAG: YihY/virulence factor BrkB family protein [Desulfobacteraceae bacterium]|nr:YihY/virulence factor BrkB family protein [Desulfobacteraceae bacterium]